MTIILEPSAYGADPLVADNTAALSAWFAALMSTAGAQGQISRPYKHATGLVWDFATRPWGVKISFDRGAGSLQYTGSGQALNIICSGGSGTSNIKSVAGAVFSDFDCSCDVGGAAYQIGKLDGSDVFESCHFERPRFINNNSAGNNAAVTLRIIGMNATVWDVPIINGKPATPTYAGAGAALELVQVTSSVFNSASISNANIGIRYSNLGNNALGFTHGNTFNSPDCENLQYMVWGESGPYAWEVYRGGCQDLVYPGGYTVVSKAGFSGAGIPCGSISFLCPPYPFTKHPIFQNGVQLIVS